MKKTALSTAAAIAAASGLFLAAGNANAATVYEDADTEFRISGFLRMALEAGDDENNITGGGSRVRFQVTEQVDPSLSVFANAEFRFDASERQSGASIDEDEAGELVLTGGDVFNDRRNTFFGADFTDIGKVTVGNFDSIYFQQVSSVTDVPQRAGYRALAAGGSGGLGDAVSFDSAEFGGLRFGAMAQHASVDESDETNLQAYAGYTMGDLNVAVGYHEASEELGYTGESVIGVRADYNVLPVLNVGVLFENDSDRNHIGLSAVFDYGMGDLYAIASRFDVDDDNVDDSDLQWAVGANYKFSDPMFVFVEYADNSDEDLGLGMDGSQLSVGARYNF